MFSYSFTPVTKQILSAISSSAILKNLFTRENCPFLV